MAIDMKVNLRNWQRRLPYG